MNFGHEDLQVWQRAVDLATYVLDFIEKKDFGRKHYRLLENLEAAVSSVATNIAEGKGRRSKKEFAQYLFIARGSLYETVTFLEIFYRKKWISDIEFKKIKGEAFEVASMIKGLINSIK